jgi:parvulin-like peptidyl-prolyl isomerase
MPNPPSVKKAPSAPVAKSPVAPAVKAEPLAVRNAAITVVRPDEFSLNKKTLYVIGGIFILGVLIGALFYFQPSFFKSEKGAKLAVVNGQKIYQSDVDETKKVLQLRSQVPVTDDIALNQTINTFVLIQEAKKAGIIVTQTDAEAEISKLLEQSGMTLEEFKSQTALSGTTYEEAMKQFIEQMTIDRLIKENIVFVEITNLEALKFYNENKAALAQQAAAVAAQSGTNETAVVPKFEDLSEQIKTYLSQQASQDEVINFVKSVRDKADVKLFN